MGIEARHGRSLPRSHCRKTGENVFLCPWLPEEYGGLGVGFEYSVIIDGELIRGDGYGVGVPLHSDVAVPYLHSYGSDALEGEWLPRCATGEAIARIGFTEPGTGSDLAAIRTEPMRDGDHYGINGSKVFITNGIFADVCVLPVKTDPAAGHRGISLIAVPADAPGFGKGRKLARWAPTCRTRPSSSSTTAGCLSETFWARRDRGSDI